jgi:protein involved in polysaccharide export with SLBB domain
MDVWGMTLDQTRQALEQGLSKYLSQPQVSLTLRAVGSRHVWMVGRLNRPGIYPMPAPISLLEAIALAGGTARSVSPANSEELADLRHSFVMRNGQALPVDFQRLLREGDTSQNIILQPDDFVFIPSSLAQEVYVLGAVRNPRAIPYTETLTLVSVLTGAMVGPGSTTWRVMSKGCKTTPICPKSPSCGARWPNPKLRLWISVLS